MLSSGPSGFYNAPLSKVLLLFTAGASLFVSVFNLREKLNLPSLNPYITEKFQLWRLFTTNLFFSTPSEMLFGLVLLYYFRLFERQMGTEKFGTFILLTFGTSTLLQILLLVMFPSINISTGPYSVLFASFALFYYTIPVRHRLKFFRIVVPDKIFIYVLSLQLCLSNGLSSFIAASVGMTSGLVYLSDVLAIRQLRLPASITSLFTRYFLPLVESSPPPAFTGRGFVLNTHQETAQHNPLRYTAPVPISEDYVGVLTQMGFPRSAALQALHQTNNDLQLATNILLDQAPI